MPQTHITRHTYKIDFTKICSHRSQAQQSHKYFAVFHIKAKPQCPTAMEYRQVTIRLIRVPLMCSCSFSAQHVRAMSTVGSGKKTSKLGCWGCGGRVCGSLVKGFFPLNIQWAQRDGWRGLVGWREQWSRR